MILHIYHCNELVSHDKRQAVGCNRPGPIVRWPSRPGGADISHRPPVDGFERASLGQLLDKLIEFDLDAEDSPVTLNWEALEAQLSLSRESIEALLAEARGLGLLRSLTIAVDHERWMLASADKGSLLVMSCVETIDLTRDRVELIEAFCEEVVAIRDGIVGAGDTLTRAVVMPNVHLAPRVKPPGDSEAVVELLKKMTAALTGEGFVAEMASFGYSKMLRLAINAHPLGYVLRVI